MVYAVLLEFFPSRSRIWAGIAVAIFLGGSGATIYYAPLKKLSAYWWVVALVLLLVVVYRSRASFRRAASSFGRLQEVLDFFEHNKAAITRTIAQAPYVPLVPSNREPLYSLLLHDHGYGFENRELIWEIKEDGTVEFHETDVLVVKSGRCDAVPHFITDVPVKSETMVVLDHSERAGYKIAISNENREPRRYLWEVQFRPGLEIGKSIQYGYTVRLPRGAFPMKTTDVADDCKPEYWFHSAIPCKLFEVKVVFPRTAEPKLPVFDVWPGSRRGVSGGRHEMEYARLVAQNAVGDGRDERGRYYIRLRLQYPLMGPTYVLKWTPAD